MQIHLLVPVLHQPENTSPCYQGSLSKQSAPSIAVSFCPSRKKLDGFKAQAKSKKPILTIPPWSPQVRISPVKRLYHILGYLLGLLCKCTRWGVSSSKGLNVKAGAGNSFLAGHFETETLSLWSLRTVCLTRVVLMDGVGIFMLHTFRQRNLSIKSAQYKASYCI